MLEIRMMGSCELVAHFLFAQRHVSEVALLGVMHTCKGVSFQSDDSPTLLLATRDSTSNGMYRQLFGQCFLLLIFKVGEGVKEPWMLAC